MKNLLFFNKEGYPHNFHYNEDTESWEGKIIFDENSDQTFKTQSLHIFEDVAPIDFKIDANLVKMEYNNNSGLTIAGEVNFSNEIITDIQKVNEANDYYSKWIYGKDFHKKFPIGTVIYFSGVTGYTTNTSLDDFTSEQYFNVITTKKNAFLIITNTSNDTFNLIFQSGGTISSLNMISINDYNRNLSGDTLFQNFYNDKKISIINSDFNDTVVSVKQSGVTISYLNDIKLNGSPGQIFKLRTQFFTERPKILQGDVLLTGSTSNYIMNLGKFAYLLEPQPYYSGGTETYTKKEIIFQDSTGGTLYNGFTFVVDELIDHIDLGEKTIKFKKYYSLANSYRVTSSGIQKATQWNTIQFNGYLSIKAGDVIELSGYTNSGITGSTAPLMHNRQFKILTAQYNTALNLTTLFTPDYIINETGNTYSIKTLLQSYQINKVKVTPSGDVSSFVGTTIKDAYCYLTVPYLDFNQYYISGQTVSNAEATINAFINKFKPALYQYGIDVYHTSRNGYDYLSVENLFGAKSKYFFASGFTNGVKIADSFSFTNSGITNKYDVIVNEKLTSESTNRGSSNLYKNSVASEVVLSLNYDTSKLGFRLTLNGNQFYVNFTGDTSTTIDKFISDYGSIFAKNGYYLNNAGYNTTYTGYTLQIISDIDIWDLQVMVNILSSYQIIDRPRNSAILLSANELRSNYVHLFDLGLSTGMIIKLSGSSSNENNKEYNIISLTDDIIGLSYQGYFVSENSVVLLGKSREFIRKPRGEYNRDVWFRAYWEIPTNDNIDDSIFLYDISGNQLEPYNNISNLTYTGPKPLLDTSSTYKVMLNTEPNMDITKVSNPKYQQTVFDELWFKLEQLDSSVSYNWIPEPLEIFVGYNSPNEGVNSRVLKIEKIEKIENTDTIFSYTGYTISGSTTIPNFIFSGTTLEYKSQVDFNFISYGFERDQLIKFYFKDQNKQKQIIFENIQTYKILDIGRNKIYIDPNYTDGTGFTYFTTTGSTFFFKIEVQPKEILSCSMYGQTEIEDIRFKVNLNDIGVQLEDDVYPIIYQSDIEDNAIDFTLYNKKRKEMLSTCREIYDYIGSYKALINSINFFGYNDLLLYEYYRNIDQKSTLYGKLHKVLIPDIFDNTVEGWNEMDFISGKYQNQNTWKKTNLFNLAYRITDEEGNNVLIYSLDEVQYKLTKLKGWLRKNIIPISANLLDITGVADTTHTLYQDYDESNQTFKSVVERNSTVVNFNYTATLNFGSDYLITVNFYTLINRTGTTLDNNDVPLSFSAKIKTFSLSGNTMIPVQYFKLLKNDLSSFSFNLDKYIDPYIYIETTTYDNDGSGIGYVNNKMFYYDEPRNHWLVNHNFDMTNYIYWQSAYVIANNPEKFIEQNVILSSTALPTSVETIVPVNTLNKTYTSQISTNNSSL